MRVVGPPARMQVIDIDQSPIGRTPRPNPASASIKLFDQIRDLYCTRTPGGQVPAIRPASFSFNVSVAEGRCEGCRRQRLESSLEMDFLADIWVRPARSARAEAVRPRDASCPVQGVKASVMCSRWTCKRALERFASSSEVARCCRPCVSRASTSHQARPSPRRRSGGDGARIKLARELVLKKGTWARRCTSSTSLRPGLHFDDIRKLLDVLAWLHRPGEHGGCDRAQPRRGQDSPTGSSTWGRKGVAGGGVDRRRRGGPPERVDRRCRKQKLCRSRSYDDSAGEPGSMRHGPGMAGRSPTRSSSRERPRHCDRGPRHGNPAQPQGDRPGHPPGEQMTVCSGPSSSRKSSLAIDTLYAEAGGGTSRSLSSYARQFLAAACRNRRLSGSASTGHRPSSIEQKTTSRTPRLDSGHGHRDLRLSANPVIRG